LGRGIEYGNVAFLLGGYDTGIVVKGVARLQRRRGCHRPRQERGEKAPHRGDGCGRVMFGPQRAPSLAPVSAAPLLASASVASALAAPEVGAMWECHKCGLPNNPSKKRCSSCQGWRGGWREGYSFLAIYTARKRKKREEEKEEEDGEGREEGVMAAGGGEAVSIARRRRRRGGSKNLLGGEDRRGGRDRATATTSAELP